MKALVWLPIAATLSFAQDLTTVIQQGEATFTRTCASGYCHGTSGSGGGAPRLAGRGLDQDYIRAKVTEGVKDTPMAAYGASLSPSELLAVVAYVAKLNGIASPSIESRAAPDVTRAQEPLPAAAAGGKALFSEAVRGFTRCSTCHEVNGIGIAVTPPMKRVPASVEDLKRLVTPSVQTATADGESMPVLVIARRSRDVLFYDLTTAPPVLRTLAPAQVRIADSSPWKHSMVLGTYSETELNAILVYFRAVALR